MKQQKLFVRVETGTVAQDTWVINPLFILLAERAMAQIDAVAKIFGIYPPSSTKGGNCWNELFCSSPGK